MFVNKDKHCPVEMYSTVYPSLPAALTLVVEYPDLGEVVVFKA